MLEPEGVEELEYCTPKPNNEKTGSEYHPASDLEEDEDESTFVSPLKAHKKPAPVADSDSELELTGTASDDNGLEAKGKGKQKTDTGKRAFREMVQEKRAMTTTANNKQALIKPAGNPKV